MLEFGEWLDKYFNKDSGHLYYTYTWIYSGMHPNDETRWYDDDILEEYDRYQNGDGENTYEELPKTA